MTNEKGCHLFQGCLRQGYARAGVGTPEGQKIVTVHLAIYEFYHGAIPKGYDPDHTCRNRNCINDTHLEVVTHKVNVLRGVGHTAVNARKTHCKRGHEFTPENTGKTYTVGGGRKCLTCYRAYRKQNNNFYKSKSVLPLVEV